MLQIHFSLTPPCDDDDDVQEFFLTDWETRRFWQFVMCASVVVLPALTPCMRRGSKKLRKLAEAAMWAKRPWAEAATTTRPKLWRLVLALSDRAAHSQACVAAKPSSRFHNSFSDLLTSLATEPGSRSAPSKHHLVSEV